MHRSFSRWTALAGAALLAVTLSSCSQVNDLTSTPDRDEDGAITETDDVRFSTLKTGDCLMWSEMESISQDVPVRPCSDPHDAQVVGEFDSEADGPYGTAFSDEVETHCVPAVESFVGPEWESMDIDLAYITPDTASWSGSNNTVQCLVVTSDEEPTLTQSLEGQG